MIPLYGFLEGDTLGLLLLAREEETVGELAERLQRSAALRVRARASFHVLHGGREVPQDITVAEAGFAPLDRLDVRGAP